MDVKLQLRIAEETSVRQYSYGPAAAGVAIPAKASASRPVAGATLSFKSCFIFLRSVLAQILDEPVGMSGTPPPSVAKKSKVIPSSGRLAVEMERAKAWL
jgi:hypothetical protein